MLFISYHCGSGSAHLTILLLLFNIVRSSLVSLGHHKSGTKREGPINAQPKLASGARSLAGRRWTLETLWIFGWEFSIMRSNYYNLWQWFQQIHEFQPISFIHIFCFVCSRNLYLRPCPLTICSFFSLRFFSFLLCLLLLFPFAKRPRLQCSPNRHKQTSKCITIVDNRIAK